VKGSDKILGGYNPVEWRSVGGYSRTKDSFIFSFENSDSIENYALSRVENVFNAIWNGIWNGCSYGPSFGHSDLILFGDHFYDKGYCKIRDYEKPIRETRRVFLKGFENFYFAEPIRDNEIFSVEDYEIFQIL
jgi:hypothetical protein